MNRQSVSSLNIKSVSYDSLNSVLEIEFHSNSIYQYSNVPISVYNALMSSSSKGTYFDKFIKHIFNYRQVS